MEIFFILLIYLAVFSLFYSPLATIIRVAVHAGKGFRRFTMSNSAFARFAKVVADVTTLIVMPIAYLVVTDGNGEGYNPWLENEQAFFFLPLILISTIGYFFAVYIRRPLSPELEIALGVLAGIGVLTNVIIAFPLFQSDAFWLALLGNVPLILVYLLTFTRRQALLNESTPEVLDQRRYDQTEILDYLPTGEEPAYVYDYSGPAGTFLRQELYLKIAAYMGGGAAVIFLAAMLASLLGVEVTAPF